jgi:hypothetical protein
MTRPSHDRVLRRCGQRTQSRPEHEVDVARRIARATPLTASRWVVLMWLSEPRRTASGALPGPAGTAALLQIADLSTCAPTHPELTRSRRSAWQESPPRRAHSSLAAGIVSKTTWPATMPTPRRELRDARRGPGHASGPRDRRHVRCGPPDFSRAVAKALNLARSSIHHLSPGRRPGVLPPRAPGRGRAWRRSGLGGEGERLSQPRRGGSRPASSGCRWRRRSRIRSRVVPWRTAISARRRQPDPGPRRPLVGSIGAGIAPAHRWTASSDGSWQGCSAIPNLA